MFLILEKGYIKGCMTLIGLDGCHLKGLFGSVILSIEALDANNSIFSIAVSFSSILISSMSLVKTCFKHAIEKWPCHQQYDEILQ